jgi:OOP family OmpA-OmpF porin
MKSKISILAVGALTFTACASNSVKKYDYPMTTNATSEIQNLEDAMKMAQKGQVDVLSPNHFADARKKLGEAKEENEKHKSNSDVLEDLGYAKADLDAANEVAPRVEAAMPEVIQARNDAITADAPRLRNSDLIDADKSLKKTTSDFESGSPKLSASDRGDLQKKYIDVEIASLKASYLGEARATLEAAKKMDAKKYAESTYTSAQAKYANASRTIETDRHNSAAIAQASNDATLEAKHSIEITKMAKGIKNQTPEEAAIALEAKQNEAARNAAETAKTQDRLTMARDTIHDKNSEITDKNAQITAIDSQNSKLENNKRFNEAFASAQKSFSSDEAEVYRQGDNLVVRLKQMQFPTGRAELPDSSLTVLAKVKDVIASLGADKVVVEGHTDATGSKAKNMTLSQKRADAVEKYFVAESAVSSDKIEAKGYGDTKPLTTNKTKEGRAENRRVDVIISPKASDNSAMNSTSDSTDTSMSGSNRPAPQAAPSHVNE